VCCGMLQPRSIGAESSMKGKMHPGSWEGPTWGPSRWMTCCLLLLRHHQVPGKSGNSPGEGPLSITVGQCHRYPLKDKSCTWYLLQMEDGALTCWLPFPELSWHRQNRSLALRLLANSVKFSERSKHWVVVVVRNWCLFPALETSCLHLTAVGGWGGGNGLGRSVGYGWGLSPKPWYVVSVCGPLAWSQSSTC
jgi:hypothetical protein